ncbi:MAG: hypothetical protein ABIK09_09070 [Pseudomonadota bacterium]
MPQVPTTLDDWPQLRPGVWQIRLPGSRLYQIETTPEGFRCMISHIQSSWIGPQGRPSGWGQPPYFATGQEAVDAAVAHFAQSTGRAP